MTCGRSLHNITGSLMINATVTISGGHHNTKMATMISLPMLETIFGLSNDRYFDLIHWPLQDTTFSSDFLLLPLGNVDIVLEVQWSKTLGRILFYFKNRSEP